jgi:hypothetical protein
MSEIDQILSQVPMDQVAAALGVDRGEAEQATRTAIPALLGGMHANAQDPAGAASLMGAVSQHDDSALGASVDQIDTQDGQKIVQNVFGDNTNDVMARLGGTSSSGNSGLMAKLLPILAPIVMSYLARKLQSGGTTTGSTADDPMGGLGGLGGQGGLGGLGGMLGGAGGGTAGGGLGDVLGSVLGGGGTSGMSGGAQGGGIGDILSQVLGGAGGSQTQPGTPAGQGGMGDLLGGVLGGLLGGGKR